MRADAVGTSLYAALPAFFKQDGTGNPDWTKIGLTGVAVYFIFFRKKKRS